MSNGPVVGQCDALFGEPLLVGITSCGGVILYTSLVMCVYSCESYRRLGTYNVLQPDLVELVEGDTLDVRDRAQWERSSSSSFNLLQGRLLDSAGGSQGQARRGEDVRDGSSHLGVCQRRRVGH